MKSNSLLLPTLLLGIGIGIGIGRWQGRATGETARNSIGQQPQNSGASTASSNGPTNTKRSTNPAATAKGLLDAMLHDSGKGVGKDPVGRMHFRVALSQCDEATLSDLIESVWEMSLRDPETFSSEHPDAREWCHLLVERMAALDPMKAIEALLVFKATLVPFSNDENLELIFSTLSQQDPSQIPAALAKMDAEGMKSEGERAWLLTQTKTDPDAVFQFLMGRQDKALMSRDDLEAVAERLELYAPEKALAVAQEYYSIGGRGLIQNVMNSWCQHDPTAAYSYAMAQKDAALLLPFLQNRFSGMDYAALRKAFPELKSSIPEARPPLLYSIADNFARQDVNAASQWAATLPPEDQSLANGAIVAKWIENDPVAASEWLATWPSGQAKVSAATSLISKIQKDDPERALTWATNCLQGENRYAVLARIMESFATKDPNAAAAARAALSEEDRALLKFWEKRD